MLQAIRNKKHSTLIQIVVGIIVIVFVFWGFGAADLFSNNTTPLTVNGEDVTRLQFNRAYNNAIDRLSEQFQGNPPKGFAEKVNLKGQVISQLIRTTLLRQGARDMGIVVSNEEIRRAVESQPAFQEDGVFSMDRYQKVLAANRDNPMTPTVFEKQLRVDRLSTLAVTAVEEFASVNGNWAVENLYSQVNEKVEVEYAAFSPADFAASVAGDDRELRAWFEQHREAYKTEPQSSLRYKVFLFKDAAAKIEIDDSLAEKYYSDYQNEFTIPEKRTVATIQIAVTGDESEKELAEKRKKAEDIRALALKDGADFAALAKEYSDGVTAASGGELGTFSRGQVPVLDDAVFALAEGGVSEIVTTGDGLNIFFVKEVSPGHVIPFAEAKAQIIATLKEKDARTLTFKLANETYENIIAAGSLDQFLSAHPDSQFTDSGFITATTAPAVIAEEPAFLKESFSLEKGALSSLVKGDSGFAIFSNVDVKAPEVPEFAAVRTEVEKAWKQEKAAEMAQKAADALLAAAAKEGLKKAAEKEGIPLKTSPTLTRNGEGSSGEFPASLVTEAFTLTVAEPLAQKALRDQATGVWYAVQLTSRTRPSLPENDPDIEKYRSILLQAGKQQLFDAWLGRLWEKGDIRQSTKL